MVADSFPVLVHCKINLYFLDLCPIESLQLPYIKSFLFNAALKKGKGKGEETALGNSKDHLVSSEEVQKHMQTQECPL